MAELVQAICHEDRPHASWATSGSSASWAEAGWASSTRRSRCLWAGGLPSRSCSTRAALDPRRLHRFQVEAQAAASLRHPHIVPVFATGSEDGIAYYAMEYIECRDLARIINELRQDDSTRHPTGRSAARSRRASLSLTTALRSNATSPGSAGRPPWPWNTPTPTTSCIATSSPRTS